MSEAVRETRTSPAEKAEQKRKMSQSIYAPMLRVLSCASLAVKAKLSLEVKMWKSYCKSRVYMDNPRHVIGSKCAGQSQSCGRSWEHKSRDNPDQMILETN